MQPSEKEIEAASDAIVYDGFVGTKRYAVRIAKSALRAAYAVREEEERGLLEALRYARRFLNAGDHDVQYVDAALAAYQKKAGQ